MAKFTIIPREDWEVVEKYINEKNSEVVLIPEQVLDTLSGKQMDIMHRLNNTRIEYDFCGEPDYFIDVISDRDHYAVMEITGEP